MLEERWTDWFDGMIFLRRTRRKEKGVREDQYWLWQERQHGLTEHKPGH